MASCGVVCVAGGDIGMASSLKKTSSKKSKMPSKGLPLFERYVLGEIIPLLLGALLIMVLVFVLAALQEVIAPLLAKGARLDLVLRLLLLNVPWALSQALPLALMVATLMGLSRLSADSEIKSAFAGGLSSSSLMRPVLGLGLVVALLSFAIGEGITPRTKQAEQSVKRQIVFDNPRVVGLGGTDEQGRPLVLTDAAGRAISVQSLEAGGLMRGLKIVSTGEGALPRELMTAERGELSGHMLRLWEGQRVTFQVGKPVTVMHFKEAELPVQDVEAKFESTDSSAIHLPLLKLWELRKTENSPAIWTAIHRKLAEPLAAIALSFFVVSLALFSFRSSLKLGFTWAILLAFAYYATWSVFKVMGENSALPPVVAAYSPDLLALIAAGILLYLTSRR